MTAGVVLCAFGEPAEPDRAVVIDYLERIFRQNAELESLASDEAARERARQLAERRVSGLLDEYEAIGGSPLNAQAVATADRLADALVARGHDARPYVGFQFTEPLIEDAVAAALDDGVDRLVGLPLFPLCGPSTSVASLEALRDAVETAAATVSLDEVSGWHRHPAYPRLRADNVSTFAADHGLDVADPATELVFSAHGTPLSYLEQGSRYRVYVEEHCEAVAALVGADTYTLGYQNHANRDVAWTDPDIEDAVARVDAERVVVEPVSFLHEQSETLSELDRELREEATDRGLDFHRVPVPHDDPGLTAVLADVVEPFLAGFDPGSYNLRPCHCRSHPRTVCLNAPLAGGR